MILQRKRFIGIIITIAVAGFLVWGFLHGRQEAERERLREQPIKPPAQVQVSPEGEVHIALDRESQKRIGLETAIARAMEFSPEVIAYGEVLEDPGQLFELKAPVTGIVRQVAAEPWPQLGKRVEAGRLVGEIQTMQSSTLGPRFDLEAAEAAVKLARQAYERARLLNEDNKNVSDRAVQEAEMRLRTEEARFKAAQNTVGLIDGRSDGVKGLPLRMSAGGWVKEVLARPGETVQTGQVLFRVINFTSVLVRATIPPGVPVPVPPPRARILFLGIQNAPREGHLVGLATSVDQKTQGTTFLYRILVGDLPVRPGLFATVYLPTGGPPRAGVRVPRSAIVQFEGQTWAYVQTGEDRFIKRRLTASVPLPDGWFEPTAIHPGERLVTVGAELLLSEEQKAALRAGEEKY